MGSINFPAEEERVLGHWTDINAFHRQLELSKDDPPYVFYDGPPFATGTPHYGHLLASTIKDIIPRYWSMRGRHVERRFGWDTHGVPIEQIIDKQLQEELGVRGKAAVEKIGIKEYNRRCREVVLTYANEWRKVIGRVGRWIDFDRDYKTMDPSFMETVWWVFAQLHKKGLVYHGARVLPYSTALNTPLSKSEASEEYRDVQDPAVTVSFPLLPLDEQPENTRQSVQKVLDATQGKQVSFVAWTTTPWTLPSNVALCAHPKYEYLLVLDNETDHVYIMLEAGLKVLYKDPKKAKDKFRTLPLKLKGADLAGIRYKPLFDYFYQTFRDIGFKIILDTYVKLDEGVGIVHQSPAFGEDDYQINWREGIISAERPPPNPLTAGGEYTDEVPDFEGQHVKAADKNIIKHLEGAGRLVRKSQIMHRYPFCPRSKTPLIQRAVPSWFIKVEQSVPDLLVNLEKTHWVPSMVKTGRFHQWLAAAKDWNVSRNRYWGTPLPLWVSEDMKEVVCVGSVAELKKLSGFEGDIKDLHRDSIDHITIPSQQGKGTLKRVEEVFDCWFESGSMPYASSHYPFDYPGYDASDPDSGLSRTEGPGQQLFTKYPGDFIAEGLDQTRGWFYTLSVLGTHLFNTFPYKNCVVNGIVLAEDGKKMSKSLKNFPDPMLVVDRYGADALRLYLIDSPVVRGEPLRFSEQGVKQIVSGVLLPLWNSYNFFAQQAALYKKNTGEEFVFEPEMQKGNENVMDRWILAATQSLLQYVNTEMEAYRLYTVVPRLLKMVDDVTNWYIRFNRNRLKGHAAKLAVNGTAETNGEADEETSDTLHALNTLFEVLYTLVKILAPFIPFLSDNIFQRLTPHLPSTHTSNSDFRSVHFQRFPTVRETLFDPIVERRVSRMQKVIEVGRVCRDRRTISLKTPLKTFVVLHQDQEWLDDVRTLQSYVTDELNVRDLVLTADEAKYGVEYAVQADVKNLGQKFKKDAARIKAALPKLSKQQIQGFLAEGRLKVEGHELDAEDLRVKKEIKGSKETASMEIAVEGEVMCLLDAFAYPELAQEGLAREVLNRVQRLRKRAGLVPTDDVKVLYKVLSPAAPGANGAAEGAGAMEGEKAANTEISRLEHERVVEEMFEAQAGTFAKAASRGVGKAGDGESEDPKSVVAEEETEVKDVRLLLRLLKV
ncbi:isoleucine--tRNA ligase [Friedmanniomyces endolithicus]|uniref:Isoleucine--tRNA ligase, cytoplasmic n=1 Tax=Friedmanniomyces endolithicus TaxID=329885 RepID=A0A4U0ULK2_9PEZI|nr:isoleucine--tRNA ligase [Friedmanniomyces endolithicus]KAK0923674.1 isoleucine--tRNA ligase [Friedmanniomyces endolithicus]KAK0984074.1 isoleucine--tRNA ligase [Friedmanniomyces endolithicus]KAK1013155.1 isoleucine--tRNA ligase [Friedmanniomyces endolithicus]KAK1052686.1 isoleucine--tRNA ligase [Friedmanniomyces endolithicus]